MEARLVTGAASFELAQYPVVVSAWDKYEVSYSLNVLVPVPVFLFGLSFANCPLGAAQTSWSRAAWCVTHTLWIRSVAVKLLVDAGTQAAGRTACFEGRLYWVSREMRAIAFPARTWVASGRCY